MVSLRTPISREVATGRPVVTASGCIRVYPRLRKRYSFAAGVSLLGRNWVLNPLR